MEIILVRHTSVAVAKSTCYGWTDVALSETFEQEATLTRNALSAHAPFDAAYCSPLSRATRLAAFCGYENPIIDPRLREMNMGDWEMQRFDEIVDDNLQRWYADYMNVRTTNGEGFPDVYSRVSDFLNQLKTQPHRRVVVFAHGGVLICAGIYAGVFKRENAFEHLTPFGGLLRITI